MSVLDKIATRILEIDPEWDWEMENDSLLRIVGGRFSVKDIVVGQQMVMELDNVELSQLVVLGLNKNT